MSTANSTKQTAGSETFKRALFFFHDTKLDSWTVFIGCLDMSETMLVILTSDLSKRSD